MSWAALAGELDAWAASGRVATLWWRDDDATTATAALARMSDVAARHDVGVALAVIPAAADGALAQALAAAPALTVVQHGYAHRNHAPAGERTCELGGARALAAVERELRSGAQRLQASFGERFLPVVVPPWNRIDERVARRLPALGYVGLSTFGPRSAREVAGGTRVVNTHVDPIAWRQGRAFVGAQACCERLARHLAQRRDGSADPMEPTGLLTHHLVFDEEAWRFVDELLQRTARHPGARWLGAREAFATSVPPA